MNKNGFTTIELLLTMILVVIVMSTITSVTYVYHDRSDYEEVLTEVINYKNNVTKVIYDDILTTTTSDKITSMSKVDNKNYTLRSSSKTYSLTVIDELNKKGIAYGESGGVIEYIIPGSEDGLVDINGVDFPTPANGVYTFELYFHHRMLDKTFKIKFTIS